MSPARLVLPPPVEDGRALFDLTRLWRARGRRFGTGVDRIDLAFGLALLDRLGEGCGFVLDAPGGPLRPPHAFGAALLGALERRWRGEAAAAPPGLATLGRAAAGAAFRRLRSASDDLSDVTYVNASHSGLPRRVGALARLDPKGVMRRFVYVHDLIPLDYPEYQRPETQARFARFLDQAAVAPGGRPVRFGVNSADTGRRLAAYAAARGWRIGRVETMIPRLELSCDPCAASEPAPAPRPAVRAILEDARPFFLALGTIEPRKNHLLLLTLWRAMAAEAEAGGPPPPRLVVAGKRGWENEMVLDMLERCPAVRAHVSEFGDLSDAETQALLRAARALLMPSFAEGLGLPLMEAGLAGAPAIVSDLPALREIAPPDTVFLDPLDGPGWTRAIRAHAAGGVDRSACIEAQP